MERSAQKEEVAALLDANLAFHLALCRLSDNLYLIDHAYRLLTPLFAFVRIRAVAAVRVRHSGLRTFQHSDELWS